MTTENPSLETGLTSVQVADRIAEGLDNKSKFRPSKTYGQILYDNTFTFFNMLNFVLALCIAFVGSYKNLLFMGVVTCNILIGTVQEIRAKRTIEKLSLIASPHVKVIRDGTEQEIPVESVVQDDILVLSTGSQIPADAVLADGSVEVNESLLTGESRLITKKDGDPLLSGSFVVSGRCLARAIKVGTESFANKLTADARVLKAPKSQIRESLNQIVKSITVILVPVGIYMFVKDFIFLHTTLEEAVVSTTAALIGMIPEGLILLTSMVFAISVTRLAKYHTLVQELSSVETLARVDMLCLDKTGTLTEGSMIFDELVPFAGHDDAEMKADLSRLTGALTDKNSTINAVREAFPGTKDTALHVVPFSSSRKYSGATFDNGSLILGAGSFILGDAYKQYVSQEEKYLKNGQRVLLLAKSAKPFDGTTLPPDIEPVGLIVLSDKIRKEAPDTLKFFYDQGVGIKIISGDDPVAVAHIAKRAGVTGWGDYCDAGTLKTPEDIKAAAKKYTVFGRVTPEQKLALIKALKAQRHTVAMTGDGVNDVLALKEADTSIAVAEGSDAARAVANLILLNSDFAALPQVVAEGRRSINNLQRSASLFLSKTTFSILVGILYMLIPQPYPFIPVQITLVGTLTIGYPALVLAVEPNKDRVKGRFIPNVLKKSLPAGLMMFTGVAVVALLGGALNLTADQVSTLSVYAVACAGFILMFDMCLPFNFIRSVLYISALGGFLALTYYYDWFFGMVEIGVNGYLVVAGLLILDWIVFLILNRPQITRKMVRFVRKVFRKKDQAEKELKSQVEKGISQNMDSIKKMVMPEEDQPGSDGQPEQADESKVSAEAAKEIEIKDQITKEKNNVIKE